MTRRTAKARTLTPIPESGLSPLWLRQDLRLADPALAVALARSGRALPVSVPDDTGRDRALQASRGSVRHQLAAAAQ